jgi:hypothetical protein
LRSSSLRPEFAAAGVDQVVADVLRGCIVGALDARGAGQGDRGFCHVALAGVASPGKVFDRVSAAVARRAVGACVSGSGVLAQRALDDAHALEELVPAERADAAHAGDGVPDRDLVGGLAEMVLASELVRCRAQRRATSAHPLLPDRRVVITHSPHQLDEERGRRLFVGERLQGAACPWFQQALRPAVGSLTRFVGVTDGRACHHREHQADAQHDRHRPELTDGEHRHLFVGLDVADDALQIDAGIGVAQIVETNPVDARVARHLAAREPRQLREVAGWQVFFDLTQLIGDDVRVVEQPLFGRRRDVLALRGGSVKPLVRFAQVGTHRREPRAQRRSRDRHRRLALRDCELARVLGQSLAGEQLPAKARGLVPTCRRRETDTARSPSVGVGLSPSHETRSSTRVSSPRRWSHEPFVIGHSDGSRAQQTKLCSTWPRHEPSVDPQIGHGRLAQAAVQSASEGSGVSLRITSPPGSVGASCARCVPSWKWRLLRRANQVVCA